ncbi:MAG TPA: hypothetical protein VFW39_11235 [Sphingomicrobium sp.]|nr:hypothetical protein [Sphingomicrobium sp.]
MTQEMLEADLLDELRRAAIAYRNSAIEAERYPHGKTLQNLKAAKERYCKALWKARDLVDGLLPCHPSFGCSMFAGRAK